ncbi:MAG: hypothetical protein HY717_23315 [Planctomycetes bacterium]|nr:hypothetical protein [Planctomycetota bacterium]
MNKILFCSWFLFPAAALLQPGEGPETGAPDPALAFKTAGPFPVGVRTLVLVDSSRDDAFAGGKRTLVTEVWYPAAGEARSLPRARFGEFFGKYQAEGAKALKQKDLEEVERRFQTLAARQAPLRPVEKGGAKYPLLIFSHGNSGFRHQNVFQMDHLASHGYVVASPEHTGNSSLAPLPEKAVGYDKGGRSRSSEDRPQDVIFLIDHFLKESGAPGSWLHQALDAGKIGVLGHSFGGYAACSAAVRDARIKAILPMTVALAGLGVAPAKVPTLVFLAKHDLTMKELGNVASRGYYLGCPAEKYLLTLKRGGHFSFCEMGIINPGHGDGIGRGKNLAGEEMEFIPVPLAKEIINAYSLAFFDCYLRKGAAAREFLGRNHYPEELEHQREPARDIAAPRAKDF